MIVLRHIEGRRSERVAWLLEELAVPYELDFIQGDILGSLVALEQHHEMRMTPILEDEGVVMVESSAILEYLLWKYGKSSGLRPAEGSASYPAYLEFLHFAEGTAMAKIFTDIAERATAKAFKNTGLEPPPGRKISGLAGSRTGAQRVLHYAENTLAKRTYFAGEQFTAADIMMHFPLKIGAPVATGTPFTIATMQDTEHAYLDIFPHVKRFLQRMAARPAFQRAMQRTMPAGPPAF
jgi:glutathione S-transferase